MNLELKGKKWGENGERQEKNFLSFSFFSVPTLLVALPLTALAWLHIPLHARNLTPHMLGNESACSQIIKRLVPWEIFQNLYGLGILGASTSCLVADLFFFWNAKKYNRDNSYEIFSCHWCCHKLLWCQVMLMTFNDLWGNSFHSVDACVPDMHVIHTYFTHPQVS